MAYDPTSGMRIRYAAWWLDRNPDRTATLARMEREFRGVSRAQLETELQHASDSLDIARRIMGGEETATLRSHLGGLLPPMEQVQVMITLTYVNHLGHTQYANFRVMTTWDATLAAVLADARTQWEEVAEQYGIRTIVDWEIAGGVWTPNDEQI